MPEDNTAGDGGDPTAAVDDNGKGYTPPASQADLDRIISDRLAREREKFADYGDLKKKAAAHDQALQDAMTESEKAVAAARKEGETAAIERANARLVTAEARALAAEAKFRNPSLAVRAIDLASVKVSDDGAPDAAAIKALLGDLAKDEPYLVDDGKAAKPKPDPGQGRQQGTPSKAEEGRAEARKRFGTPAGQQ